LAARGSGAAVSSGRVPYLAGRRRSSRPSVGRAPSQRVAGRSSRDGRRFARPRLVTPHGATERGGPATRELARRTGALGCRDLSDRAARAICQTGGTLTIATAWSPTPAGRK